MKTESHFPHPFYPLTRLMHPPIAFSPQIDVFFLIVILHTYSCVSVIYLNQITFFDINYFTAATWY